MRRLVGPRGPARRGVDGRRRAPGACALLRSHGGLTEQEVPFVVNRVLRDLPGAPVLRNFDAFYFACVAAAGAR